MKLKKIINIVLLILWMIVVFILSNENADTSSNTSANFIKNFLEFFNINSNIDLISNLQFIFRKLAHFTLYFIGGILSYNVFKDYFINKKKCIFISILFIVIYSMLDEFHQSFIPGRSMQFTDVLIDSSGCLLGVYFCYLVLKLLNKLLKDKVN